MENLIDRDQKDEKPEEAKTTDKKQPAAKVAPEQKQQNNAGQTEQPAQATETQEQVNLPAEEEMSQIGDEDIAKQMELESIRWDMDDTTVTKIEERVQELGSFEETQRQFTADDKASEYARAYARMLYGEKPVKGKEAAQGPVQEQQPDPIESTNQVSPNVPNQAVQSQSVVAEQKTPKTKTDNRQPREIDLNEEMDFGDTPSPIYDVQKPEKQSKKSKFNYQSNRDGRKFSVQELPEGHPARAAGYRFSFKSKRSSGVWREIPSHIQQIDGVNTENLDARDDVAQYPPKSQKIQSYPPGKPMPEDEGYTPNRS
jgi:hypothetical protein